MRVDGNTNSLTAEAAFLAMFGFVGELGRLMEDAAGVTALLDAITPRTDEIDPHSSPRWRQWLQSISIAKQEPELERARSADEAPSTVRDQREPSDPDLTTTSLEAFDSVIRFLEEIRPSFRAADDILGEIRYSVLERPDAVPNTRDPGTWHDWLEHIHRVEADTT
ncbi:MAG TPA: hypothetical protein VIH21_11615 [Dehalococcoidia bacterium]